jgi:hypothetical protein
VAPGPRYRHRRHAHLTPISLPDVSRAIHECWTKPPARAARRRVTATIRSRPSDAARTRAAQFPAVRRRSLPPLRPTVPAPAPAQPAGRTIFWSSRRHSDQMGFFWPDAKLPCIFGPARHSLQFSHFGTRSRMIVDEQDRTILRNRDLLASATNWTSDPPRFVHLVGAAGMSDTGTLRAFVFGGSPLDAPFARIDHGPQSRLSAGTGWCAYLSGLPARREVLVASPSTTGI